MQPNILLLFTDDQRYDTIRALGNQHIHTPSMDALCARGTAFTHAHIQGGTVGAVCMPSRAMLHTGLSLMRFADSGRELPADHATLGERLGAAGYRRFGCGKWHNGHAAFNRSFDQGEAIFFGGMNDHWNVPMHRYDHEGRYGEATRDDRPGCHSSRVIAEAAIDFVAGQSDAERPWFAYVSFLAPHDPRSMPHWFRELYREGDVPLPQNFLPEHPFDNGELVIRDEKLEAWPRTPQAIQHHLADYYAMITHLDHEIGRILDRLEETGQRHNTIVLLAGDNGLGLGCHGLMGKQNCYEHSMRVPLVLAGPGIPAGERRDQLCHLFDLLPTCCELAGTETASDVDGRSLLPVLADPAARLYDCVHTAYRDCQRAVREERWKLIRYRVAGQTREQLFELTNDPHELHDLIDDETCAAERERLRERLGDWRSRWHDDEQEWGRRFWAS